MKKRFKILISLACMAITFALLGYGVYAATEVTMSLGATLNFTANVYSSATITVYKGTSATATSGTQLKTSGEMKNFSGTLGTSTTSTSYYTGCNTSTGAYTLGSLAVDDANPYLIIKIVIKNYSPNTMKVTIGTTTQPTVSGFTSTSWLSSQTGIAQNASYTGYIRYKLTSTLSNASGSFSSGTITVEQG